jgi:nucleotide-binding universal stress UspA family protein
MLRKILLALDGTSPSTGGLELAIRWSKKFDAVLAAMAVVDEPAILKPESTPMGGGAFKVERNESLLDEVHRRADTILADFDRQCEIYGVRNERFKATGAPADLVSDEATTFDLVIVSRHSNSLAYSHDTDQQSVLSLIRSNPRPIVTCPESIRTGRRVIVAYDGGKHSDRAVQDFVALGLATSYEVCVLSIDEEISVAESLANRAADFFGAHNINAEVRPRKPQGSVSATILHEVEDPNVELLLMGFSDHSWLKEFVQGSTTTDVAANSPVPVFWAH